jgi:hypothetical protein
MEGSCAGTHPELESELRARLVQWISLVAYPLCLLVRELV